MCANLLHPCSLIVYYYLFGILLSLVSKLLSSDFLKLKADIVGDQNNYK